MPRAIEYLLTSTQRYLPVLSRRHVAYRSASRFRLLHLLLLLYAGYAFLLRAGLTVRSWPQIDHSPFALASTFLIGLFYDLVSASYATIPAILYLTLFPSRLFNSRWHRPLVHLFFFAVLYALGFAAVAEWIFWGEFGVRFNFIAVDYLVYTHEVLGNIRESYPVPLLLGSILLAAVPAYLLIRRAIDRALALEGENRPTRPRLTGRLLQGGALLLLPLLAFFAVNDAVTDGFGNRYQKELAENGLYQLFAAFRHNSLDYRTFYRTIGDQAALSGLRELLRTDNSRFLATSPDDIGRLVTAAGPERHPNVVLIMVESLSAEYLGAFGNDQGLTPNLDRLAGEGLLFRRFYATGTRTVRGMEAVTLSLPPTPGRSIVKRPDNSGMFSLGYLFRDKGYDTKFLYGGYGYFDNMNAFFGGNGFEVVDRSDLDDSEITFANIWGVCDEDILRRALKEFDRSHAADKPFLGYVMTTSNHRPYTYPAGRIDVPSQTGRSGGVKYTDYAIGHFIDEARQHPWFANTVFVIVADHCAGSAGRQELPVQRYHIPLIVYAPGLPDLVQPGVNDTLASQVDLVPTLLAMLNWDYKSKLFGKNILAADFTPRAFIGNYEKLGYLRDDTLTILTERRSVHQYRVRKETMQDSVLEPISGRDDLARQAICYYQGASYLYKNHLYRWE